MCFFKLKYPIGYFLGMVGLIYFKQTGSALFRYFANYVTLSFDLTNDFDLGLFRSNI